MYYDPTKVLHDRELKWLVYIDHFSHTLLISVISFVAPIPKTKARRVLKTFIPDPNEKHTTHSSVANSNE
jgi:hypothetical protein